MYDMDRKFKNTIRRILKSCPERCKCRQRGVENPCHVRDVGLKTFVQCLEENAFDCFHQITFGGTHYCSCRVCVYIAKGLRI